MIYSTLSASTVSFINTTATNAMNIYATNAGAVMTSSIRYVTNINASTIITTSMISTNSIFNCNAVGIATAPGSNVIAVYSTVNPSFAVGAAGNLSSILMAAPTSAGAFSTWSAVGDSVIRNSSGNLILQSGSAGGAMFINTSNQIGVGTNVASNLLTVGTNTTLPGTGAGTTRLLVYGNIGLYQNRVCFNTTTTAFTDSIYNNNQNLDSLGAFNGFKYNSNAGHYFGVGAVSGSTVPTSMYINSSGLVGIGTATVNGALHLYETGTAPSATTGSIYLQHGNASGSSSIVFKSSGTSDYGSITFNENASNPWGTATTILQIGVAGGSGNDNVIFNPAGNVAFLPAGALTFFSGRVGIGTYSAWTIPASGAGAASLYVQNAAYFTSYINVGTGSLNGYYSAVSIFTAKVVTLTRAGYTTTVLTRAGYTTLATINFTTWSIKAYTTLDWCVTSECCCSCAYGNCSCGSSTYCHYTYHPPNPSSVIKRGYTTSDRRYGRCCCECGYWGCGCSYYTYYVNVYHEPPATYHPKTYTYHPKQYSTVYHPKQYTTTYTTNMSSMTAYSGRILASSTSGVLNAFAVYAKGGDIVVNGSFYFNSDARIKTNIVPATGLLAALRQLLFVKHDYLESSHHCPIGLIAQEVYTAYPEAVRISTDFVPNVFSNTTLSLDEGVAIFTFPSTVDVEEGDLLKYTVIHNGESKEYTETVLFSDGNVLHVSAWPDANLADQVFVYGKQVDDFHHLDKTSIAMLGLGALKQVHRTSKDQKKAIDTMESSMTDMETTLSSMMTQMKALQTRFSMRRVVV